MATNSVQKLKTKPVNDKDYDEMEFLKVSFVVQVWIQMNWEIGIIGTMNCFNHC
jgi:hypothetical protein